MAIKPGKEEFNLRESADLSFSNSPDPERLGQENHHGE